MSLDPHWYSTIFGILNLGEMGLSTMAFIIVILARLVRFKPMSEVAAADHFHDLSKLMFAFVLLWAYFSVSQLIIVWSGNLPEEIPFYLGASTEPWKPVASRCSSATSCAVRAAPLGAAQAHAEPRGRGRALHPGHARRRQRG